MSLITFPPGVVALMAGAIGLSIGGHLVVSAMIEAVNRRLPEDQQFSYLWSYPGKFSKIKDHYKRFYPKGVLGKVEAALEILTAMMVAAAGLLLALAYHYL